MMKRSADQADVGTVILQFKAMEEMLDQVCHIPPEAQKYHIC